MHIVYYKTLNQEASKKITTVKILHVFSNLLNGICEVMFLKGNP